MSSSENRGLDLSLPSDVFTYLSNTPYKSTRVEALSGGLTNFVYRLHLEVPWKGNKTLVLKHAKPWIASDKDFSYAVERQDVEAACLKHVGKHFPMGSVAAVPALYHHDRSAHVLIMEDAGPTARSLKDLLRDSDNAVYLSDDIARAIGHVCGAFLAVVHSLVSRDIELEDALRATNEESKRISVAVIYGKLVEALQGKGNYAPVLTPPLAGSEDGVTELEMEEIGELAVSETQSIMNTQDQFTMGDFWTANVLVRLSTAEGRTSLERVYFIDWEMARFGPQFLDYAQFTAEMHLLRQFHPHTSKFVQLALESYAENYKASVRVDEEYIQGAAIYLGAHLVAWTPFVEWGPKEKAREIVKEGIEYLLKSKQGERTWLESSIVGSLFDNHKGISPVI